MDFFAHGFWSYIFIHKTKKPQYAVFFGLLPDICSWFIYFFYRLFTGQLFQQFDLQVIPHWVYVLYNISHSIFVFAVVVWIIYLVWKKIHLFIWAWPLHILMDIPTHSRAFLPTPFLWPFSTWQFPGISWATPWFMVVNYVFIIFGLTFIFIQKKKQKSL